MRGPNHQAFVDAGLFWLYEQAGEHIRNTRLAWGTNDIVIFAVVKKENPSEARIIGRRREDVVTAFRADCPEMSRTIERLSEVLPPDRVHLVVMADHTWVLDLYVPKGDGAGVLN